MTGSVLNRLFQKTQGFFMAVELVEPATTIECDLGTKVRIHRKQIGKFLLQQIDCPHGFCSIAIAPSLKSSPVRSSA